MTLSLACLSVYLFYLSVHPFVCLSVILCNCWRHHRRRISVVYLTAVTAWIVAVAWIVAGDNSCRCSRHKSSPATIHAVSVSMNCRRRQFMPEISLMLCTSPATIHAAWKKSSAYIVAVGIFWHHRGLYLFIIFFIYVLLFYLVKVQMNFLRYSSYTNLSNKNNPQNILYEDVIVNILV